MGYMGFGLREEEFTREPKEVKDKEKELYREHLEKSPKINQNKSLIHYLLELESFKNKRRFRAKINESILGMVMTLTIMLFIYMMFLWVSGGS